MFTYFVRKPLVSALIIAIPTIASFFFLGNLKSDPSFDRLLVENDPAKIVYKKTTEEFGDDNSILIYFKGDQVLQKENLIKIRQFVWDAEEIEEVQQIDSLFTTPHFVGENGVLSTIPALEDIPDEQSEIDAIIESTVNNPLIATRLISKNKKSIVLNIQIDSSKRALKSIASQFDVLLKKIDIPVEQKFQTGIPALQLFTFDQMLKSQKTLLPLIVLSIAFLVLLGSKSLHASLIPIIVVGLGMLWSGMFMALMGIPIQLLVSTIPCITFILSTTEVVHIMTAYSDQKSQGLNKLEAIENAIKEVGLPISLTALTTTLGFGAICVNKIIMLREFGLVSAFALVSCFIITILYTPLHIRLFAKESSTKNKEKNELQIFKTLADKFYALKSKKALVFSLLFVYMGVNTYYSSKVVSDNDSINLIKESSEPRQNLKEFEKSYGGINSVFVVLKLTQGDFKNVENLDMLFNLEKEIHSFEEFYDAESFGGLMAHINNQMITSTTGKDEYRTPKSKNLVSQYLLSLTRDDYEKYVSADFKRANLTIRHSISSSVRQKAAMEKLDQYLKEKLKGLPIEFTITARSILNQRAGDTIIRAQTESIIIMVLIIFIIMTILFKDIKMGFAAIPPNLLPILGLFGTMGLFNIPLNVGSCIVAAITVGIAVDDTIHFFARYKENLAHSGDSSVAIHETLKEESAPITITSISLAIGFSFLLLSSMVPLNQFGLLSAVVILLAMIADFVITPAVLAFLNRNQTE